MSTTKPLPPLAVSVLTADGRPHELRDMFDEMMVLPAEKAEAMGSFSEHWYRLWTVWKLHCNKKVRCYRAGASSRKKPASVKNKKPTEKTPEDFAGTAGKNTTATKTEAMAEQLKDAFEDFFVIPKDDFDEWEDLGAVAEELRGRGL
ncbi:hypothetical protein B0T16DRAFT_460022 [Cercophora newfieldiana]|uniref:Uncharacterized protein n=1 Tax=Cercophora newfieldiana TaxID=92897 RepID=A0AA39Y1A7_9PEZI|nr:hypothetical protein B0T16DRAFT_460022 [Cercophora newfieldiana]